jgi:uncharacterized protein YvpB
MAPKPTLLLVAGLTLAACAQAPVAETTPHPVSSLVVIRPTPTPTATPSPTPTRSPAATVTFSVPVYKQTMNLDCETAALQMALAAIGHYYTQAALFTYEKPDKTPPVTGPIVNGYRTVKQWGDPYTNFVGDVNGADLIPTGYGIYWPLLTSIARSHGAPGAVGKEDWSAAEIYAVVAAGHPVEAWTETGWARPPVGYWTAWDHRQIRYSIIEHTVVLSGVSATQVRVNDPWHQGSQYWISKRQFEISWADFNNMAIVFQ